MHSSSLLPYERFPSAPKETKQGQLLRALKAHRIDLFACKQVYPQCCQLGSYLDQIRTSLLFSGLWCFVPLHLYSACACLPLGLSGPLP